MKVNVLNAIIFVIGATFAYLVGYIAWLVGTDPAVVGVATVACTVALAISLTEVMISEETPSQTKTKAIRSLADREAKRAAALFGFAVALIFLVTMWIHVLLSS